MKQIRLITIICAIALLSIACQRSIKPEAEVSAMFNIDMPLTKGLNDGTSATLLSVRVFDANHVFLMEKTATRGNAGWSVELKLVPGTYSFSFWAYSPDADAFSFDKEYMTLSYTEMDMNSETEDAFWASVPDKAIAAPFEQNVTLKRPFAFIQLVTDSFINESLEGATSSFTITGAMCTRLNLITGEADEAMRKAIYKPAPISDYTLGRRTIAAFAYALVPEEGIDNAQVAYTITLGDGRTIDGSTTDVPMARNHKTSLLDN